MSQTPQAYQSAPNTNLPWCSPRKANSSPFSEQVVRHMSRSFSDETATPIPAHSTRTPAMMSPTRKFTVIFACCLTTELSGRPPLPSRTGEHAIHWEHAAPTMTHGPLQRVVSRHDRSLL